MKKTQILGIVLAIIVLIAMNFVPTDELLTEAGRNSIGVLLVTLILLVTEPIPIGVSCILSVALLVIFKATPNLAGALSGFTNHIVFFVLVSFGISTAITKVPLSTRLLKKLMTLFGVNVKMIILAIMICSALLSSMVSNVATTAVFIPIVMAFLNIYDDPDAKKRTGKSIMIGLPIASMIGGMITPAGSSLNIMTMNLFEQISGIRITFVQWMVFGIPLAILMLPLAWMIILKMYKPAELSKDDIQRYIKTLEVPDKFDFKEKYVLLIVGIMLFFWILSSWFPVFNITLVAIVAFVLFFLPKISILTWNEFVSDVSWAAFILVGTIISIGNALVGNGVSEWIVVNVLPSTLNMPVFGIIFIVAIIVFLMLIVVPVAPALITILIAPLFGLATNVGINPVIIAMTLGLCVSNCYLLPLDTVPLLTYMTGYYKMFEMPKSAAPIQLSMSVIVSIWLPIAAMILGLA